MNFLNQSLVILPELFLISANLVMLIIGLFYKNNKLFFNIYILIIIFACILTYISLPGMSFRDVFINDNLIKFSKLFIFLFSILIIYLAKPIVILNKARGMDFLVLLIFCLVSITLLIATNDFLGFYLCIELQSLITYVLICFYRDNLKSSESGVKYFVLSALSSGIMLYGVSIIYGYTGGIEFSIVANNLDLVGVKFGLALFILAILFKLAVAPLHFWAPDVYEGSPISVTALLATISKFALCIFLIRFNNIINTNYNLVQTIYLFTAIFSVIVGAFATIQQKNIKRFIAYSSIGHIGYIMAAFAINNYNNGNVIGYMLFYCLMSMGMFIIISSLNKNGRLINNLNELSGLANKFPGQAFCLAVIMLSMAGIPPLVGFFTKFYIIFSVINSQFYFLAIILLICSVVSAFYYLKVIKIIYFDSDNNIIFDKVIFNTKLLYFCISILLITILPFIGNIFVNLKHLHYV